MVRLVGSENSLGNLLQEFQVRLLVGRLVKNEYQINIPHNEIVTVIMVGFLKVQRVVPTMEFRTSHDPVQWSRRTSQLEC